MLFYTSVRAFDGSVVRLFIDRGLRMFRGVKS